MTKVKIAVIMGGVSSEHFISIKSGYMILKHIPSYFEVVPILVNLSSEWIWSSSFQINDSFSEKDIQKWMLNPPKSWKKTKNIPNQEDFPYCDLLMIALHGGEGEDGTLQKKLEKYQQKYTGSTFFGCQNSMNKIKTKYIYQKNFISTPSFTVFNKNTSLNILDTFTFPIFLKNPMGGSSVDVHCCQNLTQVKESLSYFWKKGFERILVEQGIMGREFSVGVVDGLSKLPVTEICVESGFFTYEEKYTLGKATEITPADLTWKQTQNIQELAKSCHSHLGLQMLSRTDFILRKNVFYAIETNNLPGMSIMSILPQQVLQIGFSYSEFIVYLIEKGLQK